MSELPIPHEWKRRPPTFRAFLDSLCIPRGVADNGAERYNPAVSRALRLFVRAQPKDHNADDLLALVSDDLRPELERLIGMYDVVAKPPSARIAAAIRRRLADDA